MRLAPELAELVGTFTLVLAGGAAIASAAFTDGLDQTGIALTFGLAVAVIIAGLGHVSGAHINPAVTIAFAATGRFPWNRVPGYVVAQILGGVAGGHLVLAWWDPRRDPGATVTPADWAAAHGATIPSARLSLNEAFLVEMVATAFLMLTISAVVTDPRAIKATAGVSIGGAVALDALWAGSLTGASMNPARSIGPALANDYTYGLWVYVAGPIIGALLGAFLYQALRRGKRPEKSPSVKPAMSEDP